MNITKLFVGLTCAFLVMPTLCSGDIIKLSRGISFEGRVLEEREDAYVVELSVGIVEFKKEDVEDVEIYSKVENMKLLQEWEDSFMDESQLQDAAAEKEGIDADSLLRLEEDKQDLVRYKGKYITPEVYDIIKKEREIKERRYKFLQQERRVKLEQEAADRKKERILSQSEAPRTQTQSKLAETHTFGSSGTKRLGVKDDVSTSSDGISFSDTVRPYESEPYGDAAQNTL